MKLDSIFNLQVAINQKEEVCNIEIELIVDIISINKNYHKCVKDESFDIINNITYNNFNNSIKIKDNKFIDIYYVFQNRLPEGDEHFIYYKNMKIICFSKNYNVTCRIPIFFLEPFEKCDFYSMLSCKNKVYLGWIIITDDYIINRYDLNPKTLPFQDIRKIYNASEHINEYSSNMINYYYWFSCFAYCDDKEIARNNCCPFILKDWEIIFHKEYLEGIIIPSYIYNFVILRNKKYKKIIVAFPGTKNLPQLIEEIKESYQVEISNKKFKVSKMFYETFELIKEDLINNLLSLPEFKNKEFQTIFTGHSLGGALATISSFYCIEKNLIESEPILLTFGQPRVGNQQFAEYVTKNIKQIYRIARLKDLVTLIPLTFYHFDQMNEMSKSLEQQISSDSLFKFNYEGYVEVMIGIKLTQIIHPIVKETISYTHIGGLYMIDDDSKKIYHCIDFYNNNTNHFICKNNNPIKSSLNIGLYHNYIDLNQNLGKNCKVKKNPLVNMILLTIDNTISEEINLIYNYQANLINSRKLLNNDDIKILETSNEFYFGKNISEIWFQYEIKGNIGEKNIILKIDSLNNLFFGKICLSQDLDFLLNDDNNNNNNKTCYNIKTNKAFSLFTNLNANMLYIHIKGKISGFIELLDLSKTIFLNKNSSYYLPKIKDIPPKKIIKFSIEEKKENINLNIMINSDNYSSLEIYVIIKKLIFLIHLI